MSIYLTLTEEFNQGRLRAVLTSGQAVVLYRLAVMSKDGDWIIREDDETLRWLLSVLNRRGASYRLGAPLDVRWLSHGWSSHLEFTHQKVRVRTDFFTRPPRVSPSTLAGLWTDGRGVRLTPVAHVSPLILAEMKKTNREKDYPVIGELARVVEDIRDSLLISRSARDIIAIADSNPALFEEVRQLRPVLGNASQGREELERALDEERRALMRENEARLKIFTLASEEWSKAWPEIARRVSALPLLEAHEQIIREAEGLLPFDPTALR